MYTRTIPVANEMPVHVVNTLLISILATSTIYTVAGALLKPVENPVNILPTKSTEYCALVK